MSRFTDGLKVVGLGFAGMILALFAWHAYADHLLLHQVVDVINKAAAATPK